MTVGGPVKGHLGVERCGCKTAAANFATEENLAFSGVEQTAQRTLTSALTFYLSAKDLGPAMESNFTATVGFTLAARLFSGCINLCSRVLEIVFVL